MVEEPGEASDLVSWSTGETFPAAVRRRRRWPAIAVAGTAIVALLVAAQFAGGNRGSLGASFEDSDGPAPTPVASGTADRVRSPSEGVGETPRPSGIAASPLPAGASKDFAYLDVQADGVTPVTWSPCRPIHYVVRGEDEPAGGLDVLRSAVTEIAAVTGMTFVYDGRTTEVPVDDRAPYRAATPGRGSRACAPRTWRRCSSTATTRRS